MDRAITLVRGCFLRSPRDDLEAVAFGHLDVEQDTVGARGAEDFLEPLRAAGDSHDLEPGAQGRAERLGDHGMVVHDDQPGSLRDPGPLCHVFALWGRLPQ